jgi:hypothetical protein
MRLNEIPVADSLAVMQSNTLVAMLPPVALISVVSQSFW